MRGAELQHGATLPVVGIVKLADRPFQMLAHRRSRHAGAEQFVSAAGRDVNHVAVDLNFNAVDEGNSIRHCDPFLYGIEQYRAATYVNLNTVASGRNS